MHSIWNSDQQTASYRSVSEPCSCCAGTAAHSADSGHVCLMWTYKDWTRSTVDEVAVNGLSASNAKKLLQLMWLVERSTVARWPPMVNALNAPVTSLFTAFYRMHSADYAVGRYLSVCSFVYLRLSHAGILSKRLNISSHFFHYRVATLL